VAESNQQGDIAVNTRLYCRRPLRILAAATHADRHSPRCPLAPLVASIAIAPSTLAAAGVAVRLA